MNNWIELLHFLDTQSLPVCSLSMQSFFAFGPRSPRCSENLLFFLCNMFIAFFSYVHTSPALVCLCVCVSVDLFCVIKLDIWWQYLICLESTQFDFYRPLFFCSFVFSLFNWARSHSQSICSFAPIFTCVFSKSTRFNVQCFIAVYYSIP